MAPTSVIMYLTPSPYASSVDMPLCIQVLADTPDFVCEIGMSQNVVK